MAFPRQSAVEVPLLKVLEDSGGSAKPQQVYTKVAAFFPDLTAEDQEQRLENTPSTRKWWNLVQWVRQHLVEVGQIDGSTRGVWKITASGQKRLVLAAERKPAKNGAVTEVPELTLRDLSNRSRDEAKKRLLAELKQLTPTGFEHFCVELLQQLGYQNLAVTRRSGDGGIDGFGDFRQGAVSIKSAFQAKRWADNPVGRPDVDKLRGAI
jgi:restriction system protein